MAKPIIVSFFTPDWKYAEHALRLRDECEKYGLEYHIELRNSHGNYLRNTCIKPNFILDCLERFKRPIFWLDVDTKIISNPVFDIPDCDIAAVRMGDNACNYSHYVSCVYFNYTPKALEFLREWVAATGARSDHLGFDETIKKLNTEMVISDIQKKYACFDNSGIFKIGVCDWSVKHSDIRIVANDEKIKAWWLDKPANFGDILTPYIVEKLTGQAPVLTKLEHAQFIAVGSIAGKARVNMDVWGSGIIDSTNKPANAFYHAVRGPITREAILKQGYDCPEVYGDPALLMPLLYQPKTTKKHDVGYIPHYVDKDLVKDGKVIDILSGDIESFIDEVNECERIVSSSLHGIIIAHAYGIPAAWVKYSDNLVGDDVKFYDYAAGVGIELEPQDPNGELVFTEPGSVDLLKLLKAFPYAFGHKWLEACRCLMSDLTNKK